MSRQTACLLPLGCRVALLAVFAWGVTTELLAQVVIVGDTATASGDLSAGLGTLTDPVRVLNVVGATTPIGGRSLLMTNTADDITVNADFSALGLVNDPTGFGRSDRVGFHLRATGGGVDATLIGDATIQAGADENLTTNTIIHDRVGGLVAEGLTDVTLNKTGDLNVTHANLTADGDFITAVDADGFSALRVESTGPEATPGDITFTNLGDVVLDGGAMSASTTDAVGSNRVLVGSTTATRSKAFYGISALGGGNLTLNNTGAITVTAGDRTATVSSEGGRAEANATPAGAAGIALTRSASGDGTLLDTFDREFDNVTVNQTGDVNVTVGDVTVNATSRTPLVGDASEAYGEASFASNRAYGIQLENGLHLDATVVGDINVDGGTLTANINALDGADTARGLVAAPLGGTLITGFTARSPINGGANTTADITLDGDITADGTDVVATISGSGLAQRRSSGFPPDPSNGESEISVRGGGGRAANITQFQTIENFRGKGEIDLDIEGTYAATGGDVTVTLNGSNLPGTYIGGQANGLIAGGDAVRLTETGATRFEATGGSVDLTVNGTHGDQNVDGGFSQAASVTFQSFDTVMLNADVSAVGGDAIVSGNLSDDSQVDGGQATGLATSTEIPDFFDAVLTPDEEARVAARETILTGQITAVGGDASSPNPNAQTIGGTAFGVRRGFAGTTLVIQGDVTATGGSGDTFDGAVVGIGNGTASFFPGATPLDEITQTVRVEGSVTATGEGVDASNTAVRSDFDDNVRPLFSAGVNLASHGNQRLMITNGGSVQSNGAFVHGAIMSSEANTLVVQNGGSIAATGSGASGIVVRPYQGIDFDFGGAQATTAELTVEAGGVVTSQAGIGIHDDGRAQQQAFTGERDDRVLLEFDNDTNVIVGGTVTGGAGTAIDLGTGEDRVQLDSTAQINGDVNLGAGEDRFAFTSGFTATGRIDGGDDEDTVEADIGAGMTETVDLSTLPLDNFEVVEKTGDGTLSLTGTPTGPFLLRVNGGLAQAGVDLPSLLVEVNSGGTFTNTNLVGDITTFGTGTFIGPFASANLINNGITSPGGDGVAGVTNVAGDFTMGSMGVLAVDIFDDGSSDLLTVDGTATLGGTLAVNGVMFPMGFADDAEYVVLTSPNALAGAFDSVVDNLPDVDAMVTILAPTGPGDPDPNQPGRVVVSYMRSSNGSDKAIFSNSAQYAGQMGLVFVETLQRRARLQGPCYGGQHGFWQEGIGASHRVKGAGGVTGYRGGMGGYAAGVDRCVSASDGTLRYGLAGAYTGGGLTSGASTAQIDGGQFGVYSSLNHASGLLISSALGYGFLNYDLERGIPITGMAPLTASGDTLGGVLAFSIAGSFDLSPYFDYPAGFRLAPIVRFDYLNARRSEYRESGAGMLDLAVGDTRYDSGLIGYGLEMGRTVWTPGGMRVNATYDIRYEQVVGRNRTFSQSQLAGLGGAPFVDPGVAEQRDRLAIGAGANIDVSKNVSIHGRYDTALRHDVSSHRAAGGVTVRY